MTQLERENDTDRFWHALKMSHRTLIAVQSLVPISAKIISVPNPDIFTDELPWPCVKKEIKLIYDYVCFIYLSIFQERIIENFSTNYFNFRIS